MPDLRVSGIVEESIVDGPGLRYVVFTQGCTRACPGCHNPQTHPLDGGFLMDTATIIRQFSENPLLAGVTFSGGEPFLQAGALCVVAEAVRAAGKNVMAYTGFTFEELLDKAEREPAVGRLLDLVDTLVDGPYVEARRNLELAFRGSDNQRLLDRDERSRLAALHAAARGGLSRQDG